MTDQCPDQDGALDESYLLKTLETLLAAALGPDMSPGMAVFERDILGGNIFDLVQQWIKLFCGRRFGIFEAHSFLKAFDNAQPIFVAIPKLVEAIRLIFTQPFEE